MTSTLINSSNYINEAAEGSIKNYIISGLSSIFLILSLFLIHLTTQTESFSELANTLNNLIITEANEISYTFIFAIGLLFIVFLIKLGSAPFHQGLIDSYEVAPLAVGAYLLGILKFGYFIFFIRLLLLFENHFIYFYS